MTHSAAPRVGPDRPAQTVEVREEDGAMVMHSEDRLLGWIATDCVVDLEVWR